MPFSLQIPSCSTCNSTTTMPCCACSERWWTSACWPTRASSSSGMHDSLSIPISETRQRSNFACDLQYVNVISCHSMYTQILNLCVKGSHSLHVDAGARLTQPFAHLSTVLVLRMAHRKWKETKQPPGTAEPGNMLGCCINSFHFLWAILSTSTVHLSILRCV